MLICLVMYPDTLGHVLCWDVRWIAVQVFFSRRAAFQVASTMAFVGILAMSPL